VRFAVTGRSGAFGNPDGFCEQQPDLRGTLIESIVKVLVGLWAVAESEELVIIAC